MLIPVGKGCPSIVHLDSGRCPFLKTGKDYLIRRIRMTPYKVSSDVGDIDYAFYAETDNIMYAFLRFRCPFRCPFGRQSQSWFNGSINVILTDATPLISQPAYAFTRSIVLGCPSSKCPTEMANIFMVRQFSVGKSELDRYGHVSIFSTFF